MFHIHGVEVDPFLQRFLQPHQRNVTQLLAALVQVRQGFGW